MAGFRFSIIASTSRNRIEDLSCLTCRYSGSGLQADEHNSTGLLVFTKEET
jgi:hypothetical protein